jgi:hypothetical protein
LIDARDATKTLVATLQIEAALMGEQVQ